MTTDERMEKMEGQLARVRWINRCLIACSVLSLGVWFIVKTLTPEMAWAQSAVKEIRANSFVLADENGKFRARLGVDKDGPYLYLSDENGKVRAGLGVAKDGPYLHLSDENGEVRARLGVLKEVPGLSLIDENGEFRAMLAVLKAGPGFELSDENGKTIWSAP